ncbi:protein of unknown function [Cnuella takakiae]|uniref:DUF4296 domain-containing protein n=1 Tax=Cnuella takakiae TaxID=1302690 RepID=A0A1M5C471_9BACT|nr:DUF4296 domain-containing protein [Cnuella takakiae]OLY93624.1 hypothetical protein BUE76_18390 [Cnuella takakiae]SHF49564.1 protein of unknown function [Cnuella takakiae]
MIRYLFFLLVLAACGSKPEVPENILPPAKMEAITWDMIRADGLLSHTIPADTITPAYDKRIQLYQEVFRMHGINQTDFKRSFIFYKNRPDLLKVVFTDMVKKAEKLPEVKKDTARAKPVI